MANQTYVRFREDILSLKRAAATGRPSHLIIDTGSFRPSDLSILHEDLEGLEFSRRALKAFTEITIDSIFERITSCKKLKILEISEPIYPRHFYELVHGWNEKRLARLILYPMDQNELGRGLFGRALMYQKGLEHLSLDFSLCTTGPVPLFEILSNVAYTVQDFQVWAYLLSPVESFYLGRVFQNLAETKRRPSLVALSLRLREGKESLRAIMPFLEKFWRKGKLNPLWHGIESSFPKERTYLLNVGRRNKRNLW